MARIGGWSRFPRSDEPKPEKRGRGRAASRNLQWSAFSRLRHRIDKTCRTQSMIFTETALKGAFTLDLERREDSRGFFARAFCQKELEAHGLNPLIAQANVAYNHSKGTIRGMHFQSLPAAETKLVRCTRGAILDIIVDLRPESPTYLKHISVELTAKNGR